MEPLFKVIKPKTRAGNAKWKRKSQMRRGIEKWTVSAKKRSSTMIIWYEI